MEKEDPYSSYKYELIDDDKVQVYFPEEYFFPAFLDTIDLIKKENFYPRIKHIILDLRKCKYPHGIGFSGEIQNFYIEAKAENKKVYWVGNLKMHEVVKILVAEYYDDFIPFYSSIKEIEK